MGNISLRTLSFHENNHRNHSTPRTPNPTSSSRRNRNHWTFLPFLAFFRASSENATISPTPSSEETDHFVGIAVPPAARIPPHTPTLDRYFPPPPTTTFLLSLQQQQRVQSQQRSIFDKLPTCIYYHLRSYLTSYEYRNLLSTHHYFTIHQIKQETIQYSLNQAYSYKYIVNPTFRTHVLRLMQSPSKQLSIQFYFVYATNLSPTTTMIAGGGGGTEMSGMLQLRRRSPSLCYFHVLKQLYSLVLKNLPEILDYTIFNQQITEITFQSCKYPLLLKQLNQISKLTIIHCPNQIELPENDFEKIQDMKLSHCSLIENIDSCWNIPIVSISHCDNITDFTALGKQKKLTIVASSTLQSVENFRNIETITLINCSRIVDISPLATVSTLKIENCSRVKNYYTLQQHNDLTIAYPHRFFHSPAIEVTMEEIDTAPLTSGQWFTAVKNLSLLAIEENINANLFQSCMTVKLQSCAHITNISAFQHLQSLCLIHCSSIEDISSLGNIPHLEIHHCLKVHSLQGLGQSNQQYVLLNRLTNILDFSPLQTVKTVILEQYADPITQFHQFHGIHSLTFSNCSGIHELSHLEKIYYLKCYYCIHLQTIRFIQTIQHVTILDCQQLQNCLELIYCQSVLLENCPNLQQLSYLKRYPQIILIEANDRIRPFKSVSKNY